MTNEYLSNYSGRTYGLENFKPNASLDEVIVATITNYEAEAESEADNGVYYQIYWHNGLIYIDFCESYETIESYYSTEYKETTSTNHNIYKIKASARDFINIVIDYEKYKKECTFAFGNRRMNILNFQINKETEDALDKKEAIHLLLRLLMKYRR